MNTTGEKSRSENSLRQWEKDYKYAISNSFSTNYLRGIHNGLSLISAEYEEGKEYREDTAADNHRTGHVG